MAQNLRDLRTELVLEAISATFCAVARLFPYFNSILGPFWKPPGLILGQFGCFSVLFCNSIAFFAFLFLLLVFLCLWLMLLVLLALVLVWCCWANFTSLQCSKHQIFQIGDGGMRVAIELTIFLCFSIVLSPFCFLVFCRFFLCLWLVGLIRVVGRVGVVGVVGGLQ